MRAGTGLASDGARQGGPRRAGLVEPVGSSGGGLDGTEQVGTVLVEELERLLVEQVVVAFVHGLNLTGCRRQIPSRGRKGSGPRAPERAHLPLLSSDPGGVGRGTAARGTVGKLTGRRAPLSVPSGRPTPWNSTETRYCGSGLTRRVWTPNPAHAPRPTCRSSTWACRRPAPTLPAGRSRCAVREPGLTGWVPMWSLRGAAARVPPRRGHPRGAAGRPALPADAASRIFDASKPLAAAGIPAGRALAEGRRGDARAGHRTDGKGRRLDRAHQGAPRALPAVVQPVPGDSLLRTDLPDLGRCSAASSWGPARRRRC